MWRLNPIQLFLGSFMFVEAVGNFLEKVAEESMDCFQSLGGKLITLL